MSKPYSVLLLYPDDLATQYGEETYYEFVTAAGIRGAVYKAQRAAKQANEYEGDRENFLPLLVIEGHHPDLLVNIART